MTKNEILQLVNDIETTLETTDNILTTIADTHFNIFYNTEPYMTTFIEMNIFFKHLNNSMLELKEIIKNLWNDNIPETNSPIPLSEDEIQKLHTNIKKISNEEIEQLKKLLGNIDLDV